MLHKCAKCSGVTQSYLEIEKVKQDRIEAKARAWDNLYLATHGMDELSHRMDRVLAQVKRNEMPRMVE